MFNSTNSPFTIPVTPYEGNRSDGFGDGNGCHVPATRCSID